MGAARGDLAQAAANVRRLGLTGITLRFVDDRATEADDLADYGPDAWRGTVEVGYRLDGWDRGRTTVETPMVFVPAGDGVKVAEFPTTMEAATRLHDAQAKVLMGAPNLVRGKSHSGNVATADLARIGQLDILSSDYVPSSLLMAALRLPHVSGEYDLPAAVRTVSKTPAEVVGLADRGEIDIGKRADLLRVHLDDDDAAVRSVWSGGHRVA